MKYTEYKNNTNHIIRVKHYADGHYYVSTERFDGTFTKWERTTKKAVKDIIEQPVDLKDFAPITREGIKVRENETSEERSERYNNMISDMTKKENKAIEVAYKEARHVLRDMKDYNQSLKQVKEYYIPSAIRKIEKYTNELQCYFYDDDAINNLDPITPIYDITEMFASVRWTKKKAEMYETMENVVALTRPLISEDTRRYL